MHVRLSKIKIVPVDVTRAYVGKAVWPHLFFNLARLTSSSGQFLLEGRAPPPDTHWNFACWVLEPVSIRWRKNGLSLLGIELRFLGCPVRSLDPMLLTLFGRLYFLMKLWINCFHHLCCNFHPIFETLVSPSWILSLKFVRAHADLVLRPTCSTPFSFSAPAIVGRIDQSV